MLENLVPSHRKYSEDPAEQAYCAFLEKRTLRLGAGLVRLISDDRRLRLDALQDFVWEQALDFVSPLEPSDKDELRRAGTGLPWGGRLDIELYWRLMYAAYVERLLDANAPGFHARGVRRPLKEVVSATILLLGQLAAPEGRKELDFLTALIAPATLDVGRALHQGVIDRAGREIRLRTQARHAPKPLEPAARVRSGGVAAIVEGYDFEGRVVISRETDPVDAALLWELNAATGRWQAAAWPWQIEPVI